MAKTNNVFGAPSFVSNISNDDLRKKLKEYSKDPHFPKGMTVVVDCDNWGEITWEVTKNGVKQKDAHAIGLIFQTTEKDNTICISSFKEKSHVDDNGDEIIHNPNEWKTDADVFDNYTPKKGDVLRYAVQTYYRYGRPRGLGIWVPIKINGVDQTEIIKKCEENNLF